MGQATTVAPSDLDDLWGWVALHIQSRDLISYTNNAFPGLCISLLMLSDLFLGHLKSFASHVFIDDYVLHCQKEKRRLFAGWLPSLSTTTKIQP